ncbi:IS21-like element helper ATPase IstB [Halobacillus sp. A1]|uniref:IS21-like element helper ATPase IstB n=1 Tax=Halobacillus sp. A1 TaxID=2880262 RepID=UPI0020A6CB12|nr:IS21-like element helper ATPase IstB [Halobacillus sp. A1]MCP3033596.1 IS21-like element helper ATPase IstB [Halobacillus sp. A1]
MSQPKELQALMRSLRFVETSHNVMDIINQAEKQDVSYTQFLWSVMLNEQKQREQKQMEKRLKWATFPSHKTLQEFDVTEQQSLSKKQLNQLSDLNWLEQIYNLVLLGPPGVGKTHLAIGLGIQAISLGYKVIFISMGDLVHALKTEEIATKSRVRLKRIRDADLIIIDDLMFMAMDQQEANIFFHLINELHDQASIILTSNKAPKEWGELLGDPAITTAILDRILHRVEIVHLNGDSYRMKNRTTIFGQESVSN